MYLILIVLLAPTGALIVTVGYYIDPQCSHCLRFWAFLPIYIGFLFEIWIQIDAAIAAISVVATIGAIGAIAAIAATAAISAIAAIAKPI